MREGWEMKKLGEVCEVQNGFAFDSKLFSEQAGMQLIRIRDLKNGFQTETLYNGTYDDKYVVKKGDFLIGMDGEFSCFEWKGINSLLNQRVCKLVGFSDKLIPKFLFYGINTFLKKIEDQTSFTTVKHISSKQIKDILFSIPPLSEQQHIVSILDKTFAAIDEAKANTERNLNNAKELFQSQLNKIFSKKGEGWVEKKLGEVAVIKGGKRVPKGYKLQDNKTAHPYIRVTDFNDEGSVDLDDIHYINENVFQEIKNYTISSQNLYISIAGTIGKTGIVPKELDGANLTENACKLILEKEVKLEFLYYFTRTTSFVEQAGLNTRTTAMPKLALSRLSTIRFSMPKNIKEQQKIVSQLNALSAETKKLEAHYQKKSAQLDDLKKSILEKAFKGELSERKMGEMVEG